MLALPEKYGYFTFGHIYTYRSGICELEKQTFYLEVEAAAVEYP